MKKYLSACLVCYGLALTTGAHAGIVAVDPATGLAYEFVSVPGISWDQASITASSMTYNGKTGYLAAITSQEQLKFIESNVSPRRNQQRHDSNSQYLCRGRSGCWNDSDVGMGDRAGGRDDFLEQWPRCRGVCSLGPNLRTRGRFRCGPL